MGGGKIHKGWPKGVPRTDTATYVAVHFRLKSARGLASEYPCVDCGQQALDWTYKHGREHGRLRHFSTDLDDYEPRCRSCHKKLDAIRLDRRCSLDDCDRPHAAKGLCKMHYRRELRNRKKKGFQ